MQPTLLNKNSNLQQTNNQPRCEGLRFISCSSCCQEKRLKKQPSRKTASTNKKDLPESKSLDLLLVAGEGFEPRPSGYEPDELPDCSIPRHEVRKIVSCERIVKQKKAIYPLPVRSLPPGDKPLDLLLVFQQFLHLLCLVGISVRADPNTVPQPLFPQIGFNDKGRVVHLQHLLL